MGTKRRRERVLWTRYREVFTICHKLIPQVLAHNETLLTARGRNRVSAYTQRATRKHGHEEKKDRWFYSRPIKFDTVRVNYLLILALFWGGSRRGGGGSNVSGHHPTHPQIREFLVFLQIYLVFFIMLWCPFYLGPPPPPSEKLDPPQFIIFINNNSYRCVKYTDSDIAILSVCLLTPAPRKGLNILKLSTYIICLLYNI